MPDHPDAATIRQLADGIPDDLPAVPEEALRRILAVRAVEKAADEAADVARARLAGLLSQVAGVKGLQMLDVADALGLARASVYSIMKRHGDG